MTEVEWDACCEPLRMLAWLKTVKKLADRRARLFACAVVRWVWDLLPDERTKKAVELAEQYADGLRGRMMLFQASHVARQAVPTEASRRLFSPASVGHTAVMTADSPDLFDWSVWGISRDISGARGEAIENQRQADLLRDIFGPLPFRPVPFDPAWRVARAVALAETAYGQRSLPSGHFENERLAVLADALEESGCENEEILTHLRQQDAAHVRGCWCVDLVLDKK